MKTIQAVLFDIDGTLLDTTEMVLQAIEHTLETHGHPIPTREYLLSIIGPHSPVTYKHLAPKGDIDEMVETHRSFQVENLHKTSLYPNTKNTLEQLQKKGIKMAAITTRSKRSSIKNLELHNITQYLGHVVSGDDLQNPKPHPEGLLKALEILDVKAEHAVMVGDTELDIQAGNAAGVKTIGAAYGIRGEKIKEAKPDQIINDISELLSIIQ